MVEIILGKERRRWSAEDKRRIVAETFAPGAVVLEIARRHQISSGQIHTWRKQLREELGFSAPVPAEPTSRFLPLALTSEASAPTLEIELASGARMRFSGVMEADLVAAILKALTRR